MEKNKLYINSWAITRQNSQFGNQGDVVLLYNDEDGTRRKTTVPFGQDRWYFYIKKSNKALKVLKEIYNSPERIKVGKEYIRIYFPRSRYKGTDLKEFVNELEKRGIETYEADLGPAKRMALDKDLKVEDWDKIRILYFDIETDDTTGGIVIGRDRILSFAGVDKNGKEYFISHPDEKFLLEKINELMLKFDMLVGWNSKDFDMAYLKERFRKHKVNAEYIYNVLHEDMMKRVMYFYSKDPEARQSISSYGLNSISEYFLGETKIQHDEKIIDMYNNNFEKFKKYNIQDCRLLYLLEKKLGTIELTYKMFQWGGCFAQNWSMVKVIDNFILSDANKKGIHYRTNLNQLMGNTDLEQEGFLGAYVFDPIPGYYENVYDLDFKSLYPNIIRTFNISPETVAKKGDIASRTPIVETEKGKHGGVYYYQHSVQKGIVSGKIGELLDQRAEIRKEMKDLKKDSPGWINLNVKQLIVKELTNSIYGVLGNKWFRSFSIPIAESITATGQYLIKHVKEINEKKRGRKVIYGDTDSVFLSVEGKHDIDKIVEWTNKELTNHLKKYCGIENCTLELALDVKFDKFIILTKKKYVGKIGKKYKYVGMECIKRDTVPIVVDYQKKLIDKIMNNDGAEKVERWVKKVKNEILKKDLKKEDLIVRKRLSKAPHLYRSKSSKAYTPPLHVRIVKELEKKNKDSEGNKISLSSPGTIIQYIITAGSERGTKLDGVHISEFKGKWDRIYYWNNLIYPVLERVLVPSFKDISWERHYIEDKPKKTTKMSSKTKV